MTEIDRKRTYAQASLPPSRSPHGPSGSNGSSPSGRTSPSEAASIDGDHAVRTATTTSFEAAPSSAESAGNPRWAALAATNGWSDADLADLRQFAFDRSIPSEELIRVGGQPRYTGAEKLEAMKMYAIIFDAARGRRVDPSRAERFERFVLPALEQGRLGIRLRNADGAVAEYFGHNVSDRPSYEPNTLYFPERGIQLADRASRGMVIHEAEHVARDGARQVRTILQSEFDGHDAYADYMLRDSGAMVDTPAGPRLDYASFHEMQKTEHSAPDRKQIFERFAAMAQANAEAGRLPLNGVLEELGTRVGEFLISSGGRPESFRAIYTDAMERSRWFRTPRRVIERQLERPAAADGL